MTVQVKICGLKTPDAVEAAQDAGASFLGFVFCEKSPRHITYDVARELGQLARIPKVAVTVNATNDELTQIIASLNPEYIQLHGTESNERAQEIKDKFGVKLIKALTNDQQLTTNNQLYDFLLFDSPGGGTGKQFDYTNFKAPKIGVVSVYRIANILPLGLPLRIPRSEGTSPPR
jgi:phosphoribosylanthranilate isomerase